MAGASRGVSAMSLPLLLTMGDPCGIGPEVVARAFVRGAADGCLGVGDPGVMRRALQQVDATWPLAVLEGPGEIDRCPPQCLPLWVPGGLPAGLADLPHGRVDARAGAAAAACIEAAVQAIQRGDAAGIVTAPIHKEAFAAAGVPYPGHTEMLAALAGGPPVRMMLANDELRVVLATIHVSLRRALDMLDHDIVLDTIRIAARAAAAWSAGVPRVAVAGLNPHAGEGGLFGDEEIRFIGPAVQAARAEGIDASGPHAPDTVFMRARQGAFDVVVSMVHDHGLIAVKYLGVEHGVNVTLGLPFVRTSPDHGTAFDIAGLGVADPRSLEAAIAMARRLTGAAAAAGAASGGKPPPA
jgi:4-hydroxythreonine-4-phosphate dehydrogenase